MRRKLSILLLILLTAVSITPAPASAHELQTDGSIGAVLHVEPDDAVVSGRPSQYKLEFKDTTGSFKLSGCDCLVSVQRQGKTVVTSHPTATTETDGKGIITFPTPDEYSLQVNGRPKAGASFQPFLLTYQLNVQAGTPSAGPSKPLPHALWAGLALLIALLLLGGYVFADTRDRR